MAKYIVPLRRGTKYVDEKGQVLLNDDGTPVKDDWAKYTAQENHVNPLEGELVLEYELVNGTGKPIPRLKIGDGKHEFKDLEYLSIDSFILPTRASVRLDGGSAWIKEEGYTNRYRQVVKDDNAEEPINKFTNVTITSNSKIDLQPDPTQLATFHKKDVAFVTENDGGTVTVYCIGQCPQDTYEIPITVTEVVI